MTILGHNENVDNVWEIDLVLHSHESHHWDRAI